MFDDEVREQIFAKSELQKIDLMTLSLVIKAIEEVLEENEKMNMPYQQPTMNYTPNYGAYQYNPMASYQRYQQPEPTQGISGRVVQAVETINPNEVPMDGSITFFSKQDLTEIYAKSWNADGTIRTLTFKPILNDKTDILSADTEKLEFDLSEKATEAKYTFFVEIICRILTIKCQYNKIG